MTISRERRTCIRVRVLTWRVEEKSSRVRAFQLLVSELVFNAGGKSDPKDPQSHRQVVSSLPRLQDGSDSVRGKLVVSLSDLTSCLC